MLSAIIVTKVFVEINVKKLMKFGNVLSLKTNLLLCMWTVCVESAWHLAFQSKFVERESKKKETESTTNLSINYFMCNVDFKNGVSNIGISIWHKKKENTWMQMK